jgi:hypothetical protein
MNRILTKTYLASIKNHTSELSNPLDICRCPIRRYKKKEGKEREKKKKTPIPLSVEHLLQKPTPGVPIAEGGDVCRRLTRAMVYPSQGVRHRAKGCMALGW